MLFGTMAIHKTSQLFFSSHARALKLSAALGDPTGEYVTEHTVDDEAEVKAIIREQLKKKKEKEHG